MRINFNKIRLSVAIHNALPKNVSRHWLELPVTSVSHLWVLTKMTFDLTYLWSSECGFKDRNSVYKKSFSSYSKSDRMLNSILLNEFCQNKLKIKS